MKRGKNEQNNQNSGRSEKTNEHAQKFSETNKFAEETKKQSQPSMLQYQMEKMLAESADREERYINFIKDQKEQMYNLTEKYTEVIGRYEKEIKEFLAKKEAEKKNKKFEKVHRMREKGVHNHYNKKQYTKDMDYEINCRIKFLYLIGIVQDYLKQSFPSKFRIEFTQYYPSRESKVYPVQFNPEIGREQLLQYMKMGNSIQILLPDLNYASYNFIISHFNNGPRVLHYYHTNHLQIMLRNQESQLLFGYGKIQLQSLLFFNLENEESWIETIPIVSLQDGDKIIAYMHLQFSNSGTQRHIPQQHTHKISSPISLVSTSLHMQGDRESRLIHRINQYKNQHTRVIPQKQLTDKNLVMHQKRKELEQIQHFKQMNKGTYMEKVFQDAIQQYHTDLIEVGQCKYVSFVYTNHTEKHQRAKIKITHTLSTDSPSTNSNSTINNSESVELKLKLTGMAFSRVVEDEKINIQLVAPQTVVSLLQQRIIEYPAKAENCTVDYVIDNGYVFVINGESILIFIKIIVHSLQPLKCNLHLHLHNDYNQELHSDQMILKSMLPIPTQILQMYTYIGQTTPIKMQVPSYTPVKSNFDLIGKTKVVNLVGCQGSFDVESFWDHAYEILQLNVTVLNRVSLGKSYTCYLFVYDLSYTCQLACFELCIEPTHKLQDQNIEIGVTKTLNLKFKLPPTQQTTNKKTLVRLSTSDYLQGWTSFSSTVHKSKQFIAEPNIDTQHQISLVCNTFSQSPTQKLLLTYIDSTSSQILKTETLLLHKIPPTVTYKQVYRLICPENKALVYNFQLYCTYKEQTIYKFYSSNYSLLTIAEDTVVMFTGQARTLKLQFRYWRTESTLDFLKLPNAKEVVLAVDDGKAPALYLFELQPEHQ